MKILIVRHGAFGDIIHALPLACALKKDHPEYKIHWAASPVYVPFLSKHIAIDQVHAIPSLKKIFLWKKSIEKLRRERFDIAIDTQGLIKSSLCARLSGAKEVRGFSKRQVRERPAAWLYHKTIRAKEPRHIIRLNLELICDLTSTATEVAFQIPHFSLPSSFPKIPQNLLLVNPAGGWPTKRYPVDFLASAVKKILQKQNRPVWILWGPKEEMLAKELLERIKHPSVQFAPPTDLKELTELLRKTECFLSGETGPLHLAAAIGTKVVALIGPTSNIRNGPWGQEAWSLKTNAPCSPCYKRKCSFWYCMDRIQPQAVAERVVERFHSRS